MISRTIDDVAFLEEGEVLALHARALALHGGLDGVREPAAFSSAVGAPQTAARNGYMTTLAEVAASYAYGLATTQVFVDGNKRTALLATVTFLDANGFDLTLDPGTWERIMLDVSNKRMTRDQLASLIAEEMGRAVGASASVWGAIDP